MKVGVRQVYGQHQFLGIREALMDFGVSILNLTTSRKVFLLRSITGLHLCETWGLETGDCKTREILYFPPFLMHS